MRHCLPFHGNRNAVPGGGESPWAGSGSVIASGSESGNRFRNKSRIKSGTKSRSRMDRQNFAAAAAWKCALKTVACVALLAAVSASGARAWGESANSDYKRGQQAEARQDYDAAFDAYQKAAQRSPQDLRYRTALDRIRTTASNYHLSKGRNLL